MDDNEEFHEDDEPTEDLRAAWKEGEKGTTSGPRDLNERARSIVERAVAGFEERQEVRLGTVSSSRNGVLSPGSGYGKNMATQKKAPAPVVVEPRPDGRWAVQRDRGQRASSISGTQAQAERKARTIARNQGAELVVKDQRGRIQRKDSHGRDTRSAGG